MSIEEIRARAEAATPGPWYWDPPSDEPWPDADESLLSRAKTADGFPDTVLSGWGYDAAGTICDDADREFIAHAREDVPALLAKLDQVRSAVNRLCTCNCETTRKRAELLRILDES